MAKRLELHEMLCSILGSRNVYFQPPANIQMKYPAIVYARNNIDSVFANDAVYMQSLEYSLTVIDRDPDSSIVERVSKLPKCRHNRSFTSDNLNHDTFTIIY